MVRPSRMPSPQAARTWVRREQTVLVSVNIETPVGSSELLALTCGGTLAEGRTGRSDRYHKSALAAQDIGIFFFFVLPGAPAEPLFRFLRRPAAPTPSTAARPAPQAPCG